jgi:hypothetical protein
MILNHKAAIELLVESAEKIGVNRYTITNLHALLADNLLEDSRNEGRLRTTSVALGGTTYLPTAIPQLIEELFTLLLDKAAAIRDPFEQSFFLMAQLPYPPPFVDVNLWAYERSVQSATRFRSPMLSASSIAARSAMSCATSWAKGFGPPRERLRGWRNPWSRLKTSTALRASSSQSLQSCTRGTSRDSDCGRTNSSSGRKDEILGTSAPHARAAPPGQRYFEPDVTPRRRAARLGQQLTSLAWRPLQNALRSRTEQGRYAHKSPATNLKNFAFVSVGFIHRAHP